MHYHRGACSAQIEIDGCRVPTELAWSAAAILKVLEGVTSNALRWAASSATMELLAADLGLRL